MDIDMNGLGSQYINRSFESLNDDLEFLFERLNVPVCFAAVLIDGPNTAISRDLLRKTCDSLPIHYSEYLLPQNIELEKVVALIESLNREKDIHGLIIEVPSSLDSKLNLLYDYISPQKSIRLNDEDYHKIEKLGLDLHEKDILSILMMLEKTFNTAVDQIAKQRGNTK